MIKFGWNTSLIPWASFQNIIDLGNSPQLFFGIFCRISELSHKAKQVFLLFMIQHFYGTSFKNVLLIILDNYFVGLSFFSSFSSEPRVQFEGIKGINVNASADIESFLVKILWIIIGFVERFQKVYVNDGGLFFISETNEFVSGKLIGEAELVKHEQVNLFTGEFRQPDWLSS